MCVRVCVCDKHIYHIMHMYVICILIYTGVRGYLVDNTSYSSAHFIYDFVLPTRKFSFPFPLTIACSPPGHAPEELSRFTTSITNKTHDFEYLLFSDPQAVYIRSDNFWFHASPTNAVCIIYKTHSPHYYYIYIIRPSLYNIYVSPLHHAVAVAANICFIKKLHCAKTSETKK